MNNDEITVTNLVKAKELSYNNDVLLKYKINYPEFDCHTSMLCTQKLNQFYATKAQEAESYCRNVLFRQAKELYEEAVEKDFPFHTFELITEYTITKNSDGILSLYSDTGTYTGGANGTTKRRSDTWDYIYCKKLFLWEFFPCIKYCPDYIECNITKQIKDQILYEGGNYFEDYSSLVRKYFKPCQFYLTDTGVTIYFQEITIAPHSSGIAEFEINTQKIA